MTLYRNHRPQQFNQLLGQEGVIHLLEQALIQNRIAHAYLFTGSRGTGKTTTARIFARAINCLEPVTKPTGVFEPCNTCANCQAINEGNTPDLLELDAASHRGIEDIRELREQIQYHPVTLKKKVYIIDEVHMLTSEAFNALLKTLEEPPEYCVFLLATTELQKVPITIRSRCILLRFATGSVESISQKLESIISKEKWEVEEGVSLLLAQHADGGFRDAETLLESFGTAHNPLRIIDIQKRLGGVPQEKIEVLFNALVKKDGKSTIDTLKEILHTPGVSVEIIIRELVEKTRTLIFASPSPIGLSFGHLILSQLLEASILQRHTTPPSLPLEVALLAITSQTTEDSEYIDGHSKQQVPLKVIPAEPTKIVPVVREINEVHLVPPAIENQVPIIEISAEYLQDIRRAWKVMIDRIASKNLILSQALKDTVFHTAHEDIITIYVRFKFHADKLQEKKNSALISDMLHEISGKTWKILYEVKNGLSRSPQNKVLTSELGKDAAAVFN